MTRPIGQTGRNETRLHLRARVTPLLLASMLVLASCGDDSGDVEEDRQFANEPVATREVTEPSVATPPMERERATPVTTQPEVAASPEALLHSRGTPDTLYTLVNGELVSVSLGAAPHPIDLPGDDSIIDFAGSPAGERVAVLRSNVEGAVVLAFYGSDGAQAGEDIPLSGIPSATPVAQSPLDSYSVSWSPQGTGVIVVVENSVFLVGANGEPEAVELGDVTGDVIEAAMSPDGTRLLLHVVTEDGLHEVHLRDMREERTDELTAVSAGAGSGITNLQWLPDGSGILFVRGNLTHGIVMRGQVYAYAPGQDTARLVATSGQGGPSATITDAVVSPDGRKVVYVISLLEGSRWDFHSMWVRSLDGSQSYVVPASTTGVVVGPRWFSGGVAWEQRPEQDAPGTFAFVRGDEDQIVLVDEQDVSHATPGASPVTGEDATPVGSPAASPAATPHH